MVGTPDSPASQPPEPEVGWLVWACFTLALAGSIGLIAAGSGVGRATPSVEVRAAGLIGVLLVLTTLPLTLVMLRRSRPRPDTALRDEITRLQRVISHLSEQSALSDDARRVLNRKRERELLRAAIDEDIAAEDWDAAMVLVKELAEQFGYRSDAEEFRQRIEQARYETVQRKVNESVSRLDGLIMQRRWDQASIEAARIGRLYPDSPKVEGLRHRVEHARQLYKTDLERRFLVSAEENRIAEAMDLLKELDAYLTEAEAEPYREVARGVIGKAKENLGAQFKLAVQDRAWSRAADIGGQIIDQFPNSRMAVEVRQVLDSVRARARDVEVARN
jgi:hypothetical protein